MFSSSKAIPAIERQQGCEKPELDTLVGQSLSGLSYRFAHVQTWNPRSGVAT